MSILQVDTVQDLAGNTILGNSGAVLQVKHGIYSDTEVIRQNLLYPVLNFTVDITPLRPDSKILLQAYVQHSSTWVASFGFCLGTVATGYQLIGGHVNGAVVNSNVDRAILTHYSGDNNQGLQFDAAYAHVWDNTGYTTPITFGVVASASWTGTLYNLHINDRSSGDMRGRSFISATELVP